MVPAAMPLSWDFIVCWFASFGGVDQRQPEQGRNGRLGLVHRCLARKCQRTDTGIPWGLVFRPGSGLIGDWHL